MTRRSLTKLERVKMLEAQHRLCAKCGAPIGPQPDGTKILFIAEHTVTVESGNDEKPDCLLCVPCAKQKTFGTKATSYGSDCHERAKVRRLRGETKTGPKKRIQSRGFQSPPPGYRHQWPTRKVGT